LIYRVDERLKNKTWRFKKSRVYVEMKKEEHGSFTGKGFL